MGLFLIELKRGDHTSPFFERKKINPTSCTAVVVRLSKKIPASWTIKCSENDLELGYEINAKIPNMDTLKQGLYKDMANNMILIARNSPIDTLEKVSKVKIKVTHPLIEIEAISRGDHFIKFATLTEPKFIAEHLKATVSVKETVR